MPLVLVGTETATVDVADLTTRSQNDIDRIQARRDQIDIIVNVIDPMVDRLTPGTEPVQNAPVLRKEHTERPPETRREHRPTEMETSTDTRGLNHLERDEIDLVDGDLRMCISKRPSE